LGTLAVMAKTIITTITDDLDGSANAKSVTFGLDGVAYSIDLSARNEKKLRDALQEFINHAGRDRSTGTSKPATVRGQRDFDISALRAWAAKKNIDLPARGRIPGAIIEQYKAAGGR
jgi:hypothetical protein